MFVEGVEDENQARENVAGTREVRAERNLEIIEYTIECFIPAPQSVLNKQVSLVSLSRL